MKNILENIVVFLVILFSIAIVVLIVLYNIPEEKDEIHFNMTAKTQETENSTHSYLEKMEKYRDVDIKVNPRMESNKNRVNVQSEMVVDELGNTLQRTQKDTIGAALENL